MTILHERSLKLILPDGVKGRKFDDSDHGISHCMKAVDFIVEEPHRILFIELKDPDHPRAKPKDRKRFLEEFLTGKKDDDLIRKYRDSFIYLWAEGTIDKLDKPIFYYVLIATSHLDEAMLLARTDVLKRNLPLEGPPSGSWKRKIVGGCAVFNLETWNQHMSQYPAKRTTP